MLKSRARHSDGISLSSLDVAEICPRFDDDDHTAKVAAILIYATVEGLIAPHERILDT